MDYKKALQRLQMLRGHVRPSRDAKRELKTATFDLAHAQEKLWSTLPANYFETFEALSELHGIGDPSFYCEEKDINRRDVNEFFVRLTNKMYEKGFTTPEKVADNIDAFSAGIISLSTFDFSVTTKFMVQFGLYAKTIKNLGTERHRQALIDGCALKTMGCYGLTELGHGSNVRGMEITAEYDKVNQQFILNSPSKTAIKFWIGNLAKTATNAVIFAQLWIVENGKKINRGVHAFEFPIRDRTTHIPLPGLEIGDCGHKISCNGIDNGWIRFENFRIPREALLNKFGDVSEDGVYTTSIASDGKRFANSIASLSSGRVNLSRLSTECALYALTIAIRYAGARRQFGPSGDETLLLDYPLHQYRLITRFADHFITYVGANRLVTLWGKNLPRLLEEGNPVTELCHALSSNMKGYIGWSTQDTIAECRKACGGNGYSQYAMFGSILGFNDLNSTWEGDNHVLQMQTQKFLLKGLALAAKNKSLPETLEFMKLNQTEEPKFTGSLENIDELSKLFAQRASHLAIVAANALKTYELGGESAFQDLQSFELRDMCEAYHDTYIIDTFINFLSTVTEKKTRDVLEKLLHLHFAVKILNNGTYFLNIFEEGTFDKLKSKINKLLKQLRSEIIMLTHVLPFPNRGLGPFGNEDMQIYDRFIQHFKAAPQVTERPSWWKLAYINSEQAKK